MGAVKSTIFAMLFVLAFALSGCSSVGSDQNNPANDVNDNINLDSNEVQQSCDSNYQGPCIPIVSYDLDCPDIIGPVYVVGFDVHGFDRDRDGVGCEPWP